MYCRHKRFQTLFDLLKYGLMSKYNVLLPHTPAGAGHGHGSIVPPPPPPHTHTHTQTGNPGSITEIECTLLSGSAEQDALTMKESPLKNLILFFLRPHPSWGWLQLTNSFCCFYLLFLYQSLHHHLLLKCLTLAPTMYMYYMYVLVYSLLHICDSMAWHWTTSPPCLQVVAPGHKEHEEPLAVSIPIATIGWRITVHWVQSSGQD